MKRYRNQEKYCLDLYRRWYYDRQKNKKRRNILRRSSLETESGSVQAGRRPVLITQCDRLNRTSTTVLVAIVTSKLKRPDDETHVVLPMMKGLPKQSMVEAEQRKTISKSQLLEYRCTLDHQTMKRVTRALRNSEKEDNTFSQRRHRKK